MCADFKRSAHVRQPKKFPELEAVFGKNKKTNKNCNTTCWLAKAFTSCDSWKRGGSEIFTKLACQKFAIDALFSFLFFCYFECSKEMGYF